MKALFALLCSLTICNVTLAATTHAPSVDNMGVFALLTVGIVCLVIARRKTA